MKITHKHIILFLSLLLSIISIQAQNNFSSQEELKKEADRLFYDGQYDKCLPLFSQLLSNYPKDPNYNYKFGASQLFAESDKEKPLRYLKFAASKPNVNPEAYYFLARAYHLNYEFDAAITYYNKFKSKADKKQLEQFPVDLFIQQCKNGKTLLSNIKKINVLEKKEIKRSEFYRSYKLEGIDGKIIVKPDEFKSKYDIKVNESSIIYFPNNAREVYYSSYGKDGSKGKDIYRVVKLPNNEWSKPQPLSDVINSPYDEDYPFMHPDGKTLYFCSKGHNSMGGYDVFKSIYDPVSGEWSKPVNLDFAISSADDDILFISDIDNKFAYFASNRESGVGYVNVYKVTVETKPDEQFAMIKGRVVNEANPSKSFAKISIIDPKTNKTIGIQHTNEKGEYIIVLPKPDTDYKFLVETTENAPIHSATIKVPPVEKDMAVKQELIFSGQGEAQKMVVKNMFDETVTLTPSDPLYVEHVIKRTAKLDVNASEEEFTTSEKATVSTENPKTSSEIISKELALTKTEEAINTQNKAYQQALKEATAAFEYAKNKSNEAQKLLKEVKELKEKLTNESLPENEKQRVKKELKQKEYKATLAANEANTAYALALGLESDAKAKKQDLEQLETLLSKIENTDNDEEIAQLYQTVEETNSNINQNDLSSDIELERLTEKFETSKDNYNKQEQYIRELKNNRVELENKIAQLKTKRDNSKKKKEYEAIDSQLAALQIDLDDINFDIKNAENKLKTLKSQYAIDEQAYLSGKNIINYIKSTESTAVISDDVKKQLAYNIGFFEQENLLTHYPVKEEETNQENEETAVSSNLELTYKDFKDEYDIIDDKGNIINYSAKYSNLLAETDNITDPFQKNLQIAKINQDWINDIDKEIKIKQQIAETTGDISNKMKLENELASLKELKKQKQSETEHLLSQTEQEKQNEIANNTNENKTVTENSKNNDQVIEVEPIQIENENGDIIDFVTPIEEELQAAESIEDEKERNLAKAKAYQKWANATNEVIALKKLDLAQANESDKVFLESEISTLEQVAEEKLNLAKKHYNLAQNEEEFAQQPNQSNNEQTTNSESVFSEVTENLPEEITQAGIIDENGNLKNYAADYQQQLEVNKQNPEKQNEIRQEWNNKMDAEIAYHEWQLQQTNDLNEKINIKNTINKLEQQIELNNIEISNTQEQLAENNSNNNTTTTNLNTSTPSEEPENTTDNNENTNSPDELINIQENQTENTEIAETTESEIVNNENEQTKESNQQAIQETLNQKPLNEYTYTDEDAFSSIKYNNNLSYNYPKAQNDLVKAKLLKQEAAELYQESKLLRQQMQQTQNEELRKELLEKSDNKLKESEAKQLQIAEYYGNANKDEYFNNQQILQKLNNDIKTEESSFAEVLLDEANYYFAEAEKLRQQASKYSNFASQANALQKAYEFELKAIDKQRKAIDIYKKSAPQKSAEIISSTSPILSQTTQTENNNNPNNASAKTQSNTTNANTSNQNNNSNASLPENFTQFAITSEKAEKLIKEAEVLESDALNLKSEANFLRDSANTSVKKKKIKEAIYAQADELEQKAQLKQEEAQKLREEADQENEQLAELNQKLAQNHYELKQTQLSANEETTLNNLSEQEIASIVQSPEFNSFKEKKSKARRLVKEAEVEYLEAENVKKELESQNALIGAINALASTSDEPGRKEKSEKQIAEMQRRIEQNNQKLKQLQESAQNKEEKALKINQEAQEILTQLPDNKILAFTALEKTEATGKPVIENQFAENLNTANTQNITNAIEETEKPIKNNPISSKTEQEEVNNFNESTKQTESTEQPIESENLNIVEESTTNNEVEQQIVQEEETNTNQTNEQNIEATTQNETTSSNTLNTEKEENSENIETANNTNEPEENNSTVEETAQTNITQENNSNITGNSNETNEDAITTNVGENTQQNTQIQPKTLETIARQPLPKVLTTPAYFTLNKNNQSVYNENNPIPKNPKIPDGLIFKVQVGAFRNPIPQNHFKGFAPIMAEDAGNGITRYTAGLFTDFNAALYARDEIRSIGYPDAFVVAFYNGKRISTETPLSTDGADSFTDNSTGSVCWVVFFAVSVLLFLGVLFVFCVLSTCAMV
jgi:hypothetical protein